MSIANSPPSSETIFKTPPMPHYKSDSAINSSSTDFQANSYLNTSKCHKRTFSDLPSNPQEDLIDIKAMFAEIKTNQDQKFEALTSAMSTIITQNEDLQKSVDFMNSQYEGLASKVCCLENVNLDYKKRIVSLENKIQFLEKHANSSTIEIRNIPKQPGENLDTITKIVQNIGESLGLETPIQNSELKNVYRSRSEALVVEFTCTPRKESLLLEYRKFNKTRRGKKEPLFNTSLIQQLSTISSPRPVYISEFLTTKDRRIFYVARESVKNKKLAAAWTAYGRVYVKREESSNPVYISEEEDLVQIIK